MKAFDVKVVVELPEADRGLSKGFMRLENSRIDSSGLAPDKFTRREPVVVKNRVTGDWIVRMALGNRGLAGLKRSAIALDYDAMDQLGLGMSFGEPVELHARPASTLDVYRYYWDHPDIGYQVAYRISALGFAVGVLGFVAGLVLSIL
ncbi:MAG: hypothetical protein GY751_08200 [Bacteroidetes bacterium]|nr:hypothetical protein [Bacteroidota bacterium]